MNKTKIDWCDSTWNPVTGCYHNCKYCYARKIANRFSGGYVVGDEQGNIFSLSDKALKYIVNPELHNGEILIAQQKPIFINIGILDRSSRRYSPYPFGFCPTIHAQRLNEPRKNKKGRNIFVCSMADLFGYWVPDEWIQKVFKACEAAPQHRYLFLTKNPERYNKVYRSELDYRINHWFGATATNDTSFTIKGQELFEVTGDIKRRHANRFMSIEPIQGEIETTSLLNIKYLNWVIIGSETGNRKDKIKPKKEWIDNIVSECRRYGVPVFMKKSIKGLMGEDFIQEYPF